MSNYQKLIERVIPFFEKENLKKKGKTIFFKKDGEKEYYFALDSLQSGYRARCIYGIYFKKLNSFFCEVFGKRDFQRTVFFDTTNGEIDKAYKRFVLESDQDIEENTQRTIALYQDYAVPFFELNNTYPKILATLRKSKGIPRTNGNPDHTLVTETAMLMDMFLTKLLEEESYEERVNHYLALAQDAEQNNIKGHGQGGAFTMYIQVIKDGMEKIDKADWPKIRAALGL